MGKSRLVASAVAVIASLALTGCFTASYQEAYQGLAPDAAGGAKLVVVDQKAVYNADKDQVQLNIQGSAFEKAPGTCPTVAYFFLDDVPGNDRNEYDLPTLGTPCAVVNYPVSYALDEGDPGTIRDQKIAVRVEGKGSDGALRSSVAEVTIRVATPNADGTLPAGSTPTPAASTPAPSTPAPTTPTPAEPAIPDIPVHCEAAPVSPAGFTWGFDGPNPSYGIVGEPAEIDPSATTDTGGNITWFLWDVDGDGKADAAAKPGGGTLTATPTTSGASKGCLQAVDDAGRTASHPLSFWFVYDPPHLGAAPVTISPAPRAGTELTFTPTSVPAGTTQICIVWDSSVPFGDPGRQHCDAPGGTFKHTYASTGRIYLETQYLSAADFNDWRQSFVVAAARSGAVRAAGVAAKKKKKAKPVTVSTSVTSTGRVVAPGKTSFSRGELSVRNAIIAGRMTSKAKARSLPPALRFLTSADYVGTFTGKRVLIDAQHSGLAGTGRMLARSTKSKGTLVCISVKTNGLTTAGTTWTILGGTGAASGYRGGGRAAPVVFGPGAKRSQSVTLKVAKGKRASIGGCSTLKRYLPKKGKK